MTLIELFFALIRFTICEKPLPEKVKTVLQKNENAYNALLSLSKNHDLAHLICEALDQNGLLPDGEIGEKFNEQRLTAIFRYEQMRYDYEQLCMALEEAGIDYMPLKGAVIRELYPEPWMRTSCDIDILVRETDFEKATELLMQKLDYKIEEQTSNVNAFSLPSMTNVELHHFFLEFEDDKEFIPTVWSKSRVKENTNHHFIMDEELFYAHQTAHMAKHVVAGGCGIRPFLDLFLMMKAGTGNYVDSATLKRYKLSKFATEAEKLSAVWFQEASSSERTKTLEEFILKGGLYGNVENNIAVKQVKKGGKIGYFFSILFLPFEELSWQYPKLKERKWLYPFYQVRRWFRILFKGAKTKTKQNLQTSSSITKERRDEVAKLLNDLEL